MTDSALVLAAACKIFLIWSPALVGWLIILAIMEGGKRV